MSGLLNLSDVTLPGTGYQSIINFAALALPVTDGLVGLYQFGGSEAASLLNLANSALPLTKVGSPTVNAFGATCTALNCFDTGLPETDAYTFIAVSIPGISASAVMIGNFGSDTPAAFLYQTGNVAKIAHADATGARIMANTAMTASATDVNVFIGRGRSGRVVGGMSRNGVLSTTTPVTSSGRTKAARNLRVGGSHVNSLTDPITLYAAAIYNRDLTDAELASVVAAIRTFYAQGGITTL